jgi:hypothetical protein
VFTAGRCLVSCAHHRSSCYRRCGVSAARFARSTVFVHQIGLITEGIFWYATVVTESLSYIADQIEVFLVFAIHEKVDIPSRILLIFRCLALKVSYVVLRCSHVAPDRVFNRGNAVRG